MKNLRAAIILIVLALMLALVIFPDRYISSVSYGLQLFAVTVLPALFPFFFFSKVLTSMDIASTLEKPLKRPMKFFFNAPPVGGYILVLSLLSGYPIGAKLVADCYKMGILTEAQAKNITTFTSTSGPLFIVGSVGVSMMGNKTAGFVILISHYLAALINGLILVKRGGKGKELSVPPKFCDYDNLLGDSITSGIISVAIVGGYIAIFSMLTDVLFDFKILPFFRGIFTFLKVPTALANGIVTGLVEITRGCQMLSKSRLTLRAIVPAVAALVSFGGLSVTLQSLTFLSQCKIKPLFYLKCKLSQGIIAFFAATVLSLIFL